MVARLQNASQVTWQRANSRLSVDWLWASIPLRIQPRSMREVAQLQFWPVDSISSIHRPTTILHAASSNQDRAHCSQPFPWASGPKPETFLPATISSPAFRLASWLPKPPHEVEHSSQPTRLSIRVVKFLPYPRAYSLPVQQASTNLSRTALTRSPTSKISWKVSTSTWSPNTPRPRPSCPTTTRSVPS